MTDIVERLRGAASVEDAGPGVCRVLIYEAREAADTITTLRVLKKDLTLEGLSLIGKLEAIRETLAGTDIGSLPNDYSTERMVQDRMADIITLRAENERLRTALEWALDNAATEHPHYPYRDGDKWTFPYLVDGSGGMGGGVGNAYFPTALEAVEAALTTQESSNG